MKPLLILSIVFLLAAGILPVNAQDKTVPADKAKAAATDTDKLNFGVFFNPVGFLTMGPIAGVEFTKKNFIADIHVRFPQMGLMMKLTESGWDDFEYCTMKKGIGIGTSLKYFHRTSSGGFYAGGYFEYSFYEAEYDYDGLNKALSEVTALALGANLGYKIMWSHIYLRFGAYLGYALVPKSNWTTTFGVKQSNSTKDYVFIMPDLAIGLCF